MLHLSPDDVWKALGLLGAVVLSAWGVLRAFVAWALPAKLNAMVATATAPQFKRLESICEKKADMDDVRAMEVRFTDRVEELLNSIDKHTGTIASSLQTLTSSVTNQGREISELRGAWDGYERRRGPERRGLR